MITKLPDKLDSNIMIHNGLRNNMVLNVLIVEMSI